MAKATGKKNQDSEGASDAAHAELPDLQEIEARLQEVRDFSTNSRFSRVFSFFLRLSGKEREAARASHIPQVLLLEGGTTHERLLAAEYWSLLLNCPQAEGPCFSCPTCIRMVTHLHRDFFFLDGTEGSIKIDSIRSLKPFLGEPPREAHYRIVLFREAQAMAAPAANSLLKSLEEPQASTSFLLLAPQRERLLPTLVSRSMVVTLPWPERTSSGATSMLEAALLQFAKTGQGWFSLTATKGSVTQDTVHEVITILRNAMLEALGGQSATPSALAELLTKFPLERLRFLDEVLAKAQDSAVTGVNPAVVLDWVATRFFLLMPR